MEIDPETWRLWIETGAITFGALGWLLKRKGKLSPEDQKQLERLEAKIDLNSIKLEKLQQAVHAHLGPNPTTSEVIAATTDSILNTPIKDWLDLDPDVRLAGDQ